MNENSRGLVGAALGVLPTILPDIIGGIKSLDQKVKKKRSDKHTNWFKSRLTPEEYQNNYDNLLKSSYYIIPKK